MKAVYKKDLKSAFTGMIGWVLCAFVVVVVGLYFTAICLQSGYADFSLVLYNTRLSNLFPAKKKTPSRPASSALAARICAHRRALRWRARAWPCCAWTPKQQAWRMCSWS